MDPASEGPDGSAEALMPWLSFGKSAESLFGAVLTASEVELRELHGRLWPHLAFDEAGFRRKPQEFRWLMAKRAVSHAHGEDASQGLAMLAEGLTSVWQSQPELQAEVVKRLLFGESTDDLLQQFASVAGIPWPSPTEPPPQGD